MFLQSGGIANFVAAEGSSDLLGYGLLFTEFGKEGFVEEVLDIFGVVKGCVLRGRLGSLPLASGFARVDTYPRE